MGELLAFIVIAYAILIGVWLLGVLATIMVYAAAAVAAVIGLPVWAAWSAVSRLGRRRP
jgi:hypothetical protein